MKNNNAKAVSLLTVWLRNPYRFNASLEGCVDAFQGRPFSRDYENGFGEIKGGRVNNAQYSYELGRMIGVKIRDQYESFPTFALTPRGLLYVANRSGLTDSDVNPRLFPYKGAIKRS